MSNLPEINAYLEAPSSKSVTQRAIAGAVLANGTSTIRRISCCNDCLAALDIAAGLGAQVVKTEDEVRITGNFHLAQETIHCQESAFCARLFTPIAVLQNSPVEISGSGTLLHRSMADLVAALTAFGVKTTGYYNEPALPLQCTGPLQAATAIMDFSSSSQTLSGLLMALPLTNGDSEIIVKNLVSRPYIDMTLDVMHTFGVDIEHTDYKQFLIKGRQHYTPQTYVVEGDWSNAAFWLVAAAIQGNITIANLQANSRQGDKAIVDVLQQTGAKITWDNDLLTVRSREHQPFRFDASDCPDLFPPLVLLASFCNGISEIEGIHRLQNKESHRALALQETFGALGVTIYIEEDTLIIRGGLGIHGGSVSSFHDHRIAMAAACAGLFTHEPVEIDDRMCVEKSYPAFWDDLKKLRK